MPRRSYRIYPDSTLLSVATNPHTKNGAAAKLLQYAKDYCTVIYSIITIQENGPENSTMPRLADRRLKALRGKNCERIPQSKPEIAVLAWEVLKKIGVKNKKATCLSRDAHHYAAAVLGRADIIITDNRKDFEALRNGLLQLMSDYRIPIITSLQEAYQKISENPGPDFQAAEFRKLYARQQYWSMRDYGYPDKIARQYIERKWRLKLPKRFP